MINDVAQKVKERLGDNVFGEDNQIMEKVVGQMLFERHRTIAFAESCTGGLVLDRITDVPGEFQTIFRAES